MYAGMPAGAMTGGLLAAYLIPHFGWQALFLFSGSAPLAISLLVAFALPESLEFLVRRNTGTDSEKARRIIAKIAPWLATNRDIEFVATDKKRPGAAFTRLFTDGRGVTTLLLWLVCSGALYLLWILNTWSPTLLRNSGATVQQYSLAYAFLCFGAVVSSVCIGRLMDSFNPFAMLQVGFFLAALSLVAFGLGASSGSFVIIALLSVICGICINGSQTGTLAIATLAYPTDIRATGIGWAYAIAKIGAMLAPLAGGYMLGRGWSVAQLCNVNALVGIFIVGVLMLLRQRVARSIEEAGKKVTEDVHVSVDLGN
jgi:AAHS family 4-hydroxybenzoate transporter-like MFS transporter